MSPEARAAELSKGAEIEEARRSNRKRGVFWVVK
jgi:hypothetical protein